VEADRISEALSSAIRHITLTTLTSETPIVEKVLTTEVVLRVLVAPIVVALVALIVLLAVLNIDDSIQASVMDSHVFIDILSGEVTIIKNSFFQKGAYQQMSIPKELFNCEDQSRSANFFIHDPDGVFLF
jgi:hypothetical protein